ncbi:MAG TPA: hypothetical protein V6D50_07775 [Chroococcales cyanobacterium]
MPQKDAKSQALRVRRNQEGRALLSDSYKHRGSGQDGTAEENLSLRTSGENRSRSDSDCSPRETTVGGILRELMDEVDQQSAYLSSQLKKLSDRRRQLEDFYRELQAQAGQGNDVESEDEGE